MKLLLILSCFCFMDAWAQEMMYEIKGSLGTNVTTNKKILFNLKWREKNGKAVGIYTDNFYTKSSIAKGISGKLGRIFLVTLPKQVNGVRTIAFLGADFKNDKNLTNIPLSVVLRNNNGKPVSTNSIQANSVVVSQNRVAQRQEPRECSEGFGVLTGYCGAYSGMITEEVDSNKKCNLLVFSNSRLILDGNSEMGLALGEINGVVNPPVHRIGRMFTDPKSMRIDLTGRSCRPLAGTTFKGDNCKRLSLSGVFSILRNTKHFSGYYSIVDETTNELCRYRLSMDQAI